MASKAPPLGPPPPDGDRRRGHQIVITQFVFMSIAAVLIVLRLYVRTRITRKIGWDDILITIAWIVTTIGLGFNVKMVEEGFGRHLYYLKSTPLQIVRATHWHIIWQPTFFISVTLTRISICLLLLRIFGVNQVWRWGLWAAIGLILAINIPSFIMVFTQCRPYEKSWNAKVPGYCWPADNNVKVALYSGIMAVIQDWALATLPIVFLWNIQIGIRQKIGIIVLMSMGYFTGICAIVRTVISMQVFDAGGLADFSWVIIDLRIWGTAENLVGIIAASIPTVKPLWAQHSLSQYFPWSKKGSSAEYHAENEERGHKVGQPADPYSISYTGGHGVNGDKRGYRSDNIELDQFDDRRPIAEAPRTTNEVYHV